MDNINVTSESQEIPGYTLNGDKLNTFYDNNLNEKDFQNNKNNAVNHAQQFELTEPDLELCQEISTSDLIIREIIEDCILKAINKARNESQSQEYSEDDVDDEYSLNIPHVRRSSSLKSGRTPPNTPRCKKIVRFADVLGLDLADIKTYLDEIPKIPLSAYEDLTDCGDNLTTVEYKQEESTLLPLFQQPVTNSNFLTKITMNMVGLENAFVDDDIPVCIKGVVRVRNLEFNKSVHIRFTLDLWKTCIDHPANYISGSSDGFTDRFEFIIYPQALKIGQNLEFAVRFQCKGHEYWDNNNGRNYCFQSLPAPNSEPLSIITTLNEQIASFYYADIDGIRKRMNKKEKKEMADDIQEDEEESKKVNVNVMSSMEVQDYIMQSLNKNVDKHQIQDCSNFKPEIIVFLLIICVLIMGLLIKRVIF